MTTPWPHRWRPVVDADRSFRMWQCDGGFGESCYEDATWIAERGVGERLSVVGHACDDHVPAKARLSSAGTSLRYSFYVVCADGMDRPNVWHRPPAALPNQRTYRIDVELPEVAIVDGVLRVQARVVDEPKKTW